ncbi:glutaredoxin-like protein [Lipomyces chichibuensis]|uniref:glutaredoxin-like protein n=1 Tax=Lipomyces chichibuensis TaxID=1546026 RepID=UPI003343E416
MTIFSRPQCGLCDEAKESIAKAIKHLPQFRYSEIDILKSENQEWFDKYAYEVPVIHFQTAENEVVKKIMHKIHEQDVIDLVQKSIDAKKSS